MTPAPNPMLPPTRIERDDGRPDATDRFDLQDLPAAPSTGQIDIGSAMIQVYFGVDQASLHAR
jgi:hypothetical protein